MPNIAFIGKMGAGKTTAAKHLMGRYGYTGLHFAQKLKGVAIELWGKEATTNRGLMQSFGVKMREVDPDVWVNYLLNYMEGLTQRSLSGGFCVDDVRFPNEYEALARRGFKFVELISDETTRVDRLQRNGKLEDVSQLTHESETALDDFELYRRDYVIENDADTWRVVESLDAIIDREASRV